MRSEQCPHFLHNTLELISGLMLYSISAELLAGFFSYWSAFDFSENVLISRTASAMPVAEFLDKDNMKDGRIRNFKVGSRVRN